ncbi:MAG: hypothetical protein OXI56_06150 [bacterium]|nr:hypothetical protein [bacterium]MDE0601361.1 hypothetical protein [bacterium]
MSETPVPVEVVGSEGVRLRGLEWPVAGPPVIFVHDFGADLDQWGPLTAGLAASGFRVISLELSGHGLSDGEPDPGSVARDIRVMVAQASRLWGPLGLVTCGESARGSVGTGAASGAPVQILISPPDMPVEFMKGGEKALRIMMAGGGDAEGHAYAKKAHDHLPGQRMLMTLSGATERGVALAGLRPSVLEDMAQFFRLYLAPVNMAWITRKEAEAEKPS